MITELDDLDVDPTTTDRVEDGGVGLDQSDDQGSGYEHDEAFEQREGGLAKPIERFTAKLPSDVFLWAAVGSIAASLGLLIAGRKHRSLFVGQWAPTFLILGLYNKLVKVAGHDRTGEPSTSTFSRD